MTLRQLRLVITQGYWRKIPYPVIQTKLYAIIVDSTNVCSPIEMREQWYFRQPQLALLPE